MRCRGLFRWAGEATVSEPHSGLLPTGTPPASPHVGGGEPALVPAALGVVPTLAAAVDPVPRPFMPGAGLAAVCGRPTLTGDPRAACRLLEELLLGAAGEAAAELELELDGVAPPPTADCFDAMEESPLGGVTGGRRPLHPSARVRPPVATRVDAALYRGHPRLCSVLTRGLKVRVPTAAPRVWAVTPRSALMSAAVGEFVAAGILRPGRPQSCYRLVPVPKSDSSARLIYDLSSLTPFMPSRPCPLPSVERALALSAAGYRYCIKIDLRDGFYHIPLAESTSANFGVCYSGQTYLFARLPMGLSIAPAEMQHFACVTVKLVEASFPGVKGMAYLDDFLFVARQPADLSGVADYFARAGININFEKSVLSPVSRVIYLGIDVDLSHAAAQVKPGILCSVRSAMMQCSASWPAVWRQRLAGYVNFLRPCLKLPLEVVRAILDGDAGACAAVVPFLRDDVQRTFEDICLWNDVHDRLCFVDATPQQIGIVCAGFEPVSVRLSEELPIYLAEYLAALTAVLCADREPVTIVTDNLGVYYNLNKGRCPRPFLSLMCRLFRDRVFSLGFIPSHMNPADVPSRCRAAGLGARRSV